MSITISCMNNWCGDKGGFFLNGTSRSEIACYGSVYCFSGSLK